ncbi:hypothetical protein DPEC_G00197390 [Dallia pectoralis]|uniref:Uncharacterized protein n=1 Tax=Dallia pectoralis TaxID=75939 RepID=A0ACC2G8D0_DALPE|nr:hypothetical protein DPEC_G00197390 [Dallia pectoralis]
MGNEGSVEGDGQPGSGVPPAGAPTSISAPAGTGQLVKPSNGAPTGGTGAGPRPGINSASGRPPQTDPGSGPKAGVQTGPGTGDRLAAQGEQQGQGHQARKNLQVDVGSRAGRSPSASSDPGGVTPTSPYSVPQIAPMPSSKLCPVCKTADLTGTTDDNQPNANTCTQCRSTVCNQCGFNPNPHLTEILYIPSEKQMCPHYTRLMSGVLTLNVCGYQGINVCQMTKIEIRAEKGGLREVEKERRRHGLQEGNRRAK